MAELPKGGPDATAAGNGSAAAAEHDRRLAAALERMSDAFVALDAEWRYTYVNARAGELFGRDPAALVGKHVWDEFPEGVGQPFQRAYERAMATQQPVVFEDHYAPWDRWFENRVYPSPDGVSIFFTEVTDRRRAERALAESSRAYAAIADHSPDIITRYDRDLRIVYINPTVEEYVGAAPALLVGHTHRELGMAPELISFFEGSLHRAFAGDAHETDYVMRDPRGVARTMLARVVPEHGADGSVETVLVISRDVTAQRLAEARFQALVEQSLVGVFVANQQRRLTFVSPYLAALVGRAADELTAMPDPTALLAPEDVPRTIDAVRRGVAPGGVSRFDVRVPRPDGSAVHLEVHGGTSHVAGEPVYVGVVVDVTAHEAAVAALRDSEARFRALAEHAPVGIILMGTDGGVAYANPRAVEIVGYPASMLLGEGWEQSIHPDDLPQLRAGLESLLRGEVAVLHHTHRGMRADGSLRRITGQAVPVRDVHGRATGYVSTFEDETERREMEEALHQAQKMEAVGQLAGGVAHDFNNMLTAISGNLELALLELDAVPRALTSGARDLLGEAQRAAMRAGALTRRLLAFGRKQVLHARPLRLDTVVRDTLPMLERLIGEDIAVEAVLGDGRETVVLDPVQLEQVLLNLALNARDAMRASAEKRLTIVTCDVVVDTPESPGRAVPPVAHAASILGTASRPGLAPGSYAVLAVRDTGHGMDAATQSRIFEPFFTTKGAGEGTGLGLATVYGIVQQSGGFVYVDSAPERGATFTLYFRAFAAREARDGGGDAGIAPRAGATAIGASPSVGGATAASDAPGAGTVLVIEDEDSVRRIARRTLAAAGFTVHEAADSAGALALWPTIAGEVDLVVTDMVMPGLDGLALVTQLRARRPDLPAVLMSGYSETLATAQGELPPRTHWLEKPFTGQALLDEIRSALRA